MILVVQGVKSLGSVLFAPRVPENSKSSGRKSLLEKSTEGPVQPNRLLFFRIIQLPLVIR
jgi:hypothetical protein